MSAPLHRLGEQIRAAQDQALAERPDELARARAGAVAAFEKRRPAPRRFALAAGVMVLAAAAAIMVVSRPWNEPAIEYRVGLEREAGGVGRWLSSGDATLGLHFSEGSEITLSPETDAQVVALRAEGAEVRLDRGRAEVSVHHDEGTEWTLASGPFRVEVVGTRFSVAWDPSDAVFELQMQEGAVELTGPVLESRTVRGGESIRVRLRDGRAEVEERVQDAREEEAVEDTSAEASLPPSEELPVAAPASSEVRRDRRIERGHLMTQLAREGRYEEAFTAAREEGWSQTLRTADATELLALGDAARLGGHPNEAIEVYESLSARFPRSALRPRATFALARVALDQQHDARRAASLFERYLREAPSGTLAREATGRLIEAHLALGERDRARVLARDYLSRYPEGAHARLARSLAEVP
jgi:TolA-binding protein